MASLVLREKGNLLPRMRGVGKLGSRKDFIVAGRGAGTANALGVEGEMRGVSTEKPSS